MGARFISARARATRCRCPPDSISPRSPTFVWYPSSKSFTSASSWAVLAAARTSSSWPSLLPYTMLYQRSSLKSDASCCTTAMAWRRLAGVTSTTF
mmetsp:Transcript_46686/g.109850  ORF Transcript_46686/g.109850 Transcript_46686/m.109850 type:complete len:96 (+) Transcript_46686:824-1111(+)